MKSSVVVLLVVSGFVSLFLGCESGLADEQAEPAASSQEVERAEPTEAAESGEQAREATESGASEEAGLSEPEALPGNIAARIGDYEITRAELEKAVLRELGPRYFTDLSEASEPVKVEEVLRELLGREAMIMDARERNLLELEPAKTKMKKFEDKNLATMLLQDLFKEEVLVTEAEIKAAMAEDEKLTAERAKQMLQSKKARQVVEDFYAELVEKRNVTKRRENFEAVVEMRQRLKANSPKGPSGMPTFIRTSQIETDLTDAEKEMVLARFEGGEFTVKDWFDALSDIAPPSRPRNLGHIGGVEQFLDNALRMPVFAAEAGERGYAERPDYIKKRRQRAEDLLYYEAYKELTEGLEEAGEEVVKSYYEAHKQDFARPTKLVVDDIWFESRQAASEAKESLESGKSFDDLSEGLERTKDRTLWPGTDRLGYEEFLRAGVGKVVGPIKGVHKGEVKWRLVKVVEKEPGGEQEFNDSTKNNVASALRSKRREELLREYREELLERYECQINQEAIAGLEKLCEPY